LEDGFDPPPWHDEEDLARSLSLDSALVQDLLGHEDDVLGSITESDPSLGSLMSSQPSESSSGAVVSGDSRSLPDVEDPAQEGSQAQYVDDIVPILIDEDGDVFAEGDYAILMQYLEQLLGSGREPGTRNSQWEDVWHEPVSDAPLPNNHKHMSVLQYSVDKLYQYCRYRRSRLDLNEDLEHRAKFQEPAWEPGPYNPHNRRPTSLKQLRTICQVPESTEFEFHVCSRGCIWWWPYKKDAHKHWSQCIDPRCPSCKCPCCGTPRYYKHPKKGVLPVQKCYFFYNIFQTFLYDKKWAEAVLEARALGSSSIRQTKFWEDLRQQLIESGFSLDQVCSSLQAHVFHCRMLYSWPPDGLL
jgi:hypothetical protein